MARPTRRVSRGTTTRRKLVWARSITTGLAIGAGGTTNDPLLADFQVTYGAQLIGCTVMRIRGYLKLADAFGADDQVGVGIRVITDTETLPAAGGPFADPHADWMFYDILEDSTGIGGLRFDVRAKRKIDELGQGLSMLFESNSGAATTVDLFVSTLVALP